MNNQHSYLGRACPEWPRCGCGGLPCKRQLDADRNRRLDHAEDYVRDALRIMGQHEDAANPAMVRETAERVLLAIYGRNLPR